MNETPSTEPFEARIAALAPLTTYGPEYNRGVVDAIGDARLFASRGDADAAEHYLLVAEARAGRITFDEFEARDPFTPVRVIVTDGPPAWVADGPGDHDAAEQRDRIRSAMESCRLPWPEGRVEIRHSHGPADDLRIALELLAAMGMVAPLQAWPTGQLEPDGGIRNAAGIGEGSLRGIYERYRR